MSITKLKRILATGLGFFCFGFFGLFFQFGIFPTIILLVRNKELRHRIARKVISKVFNFFLCFLRLLGVISWSTKNIELLQRPGQLILSNHLTLIDVVFLFSFAPNASAIIKASLSRNPFMWAAIKAAGYITNDEGPRLIDECVSELKHGGSLIIFPEGTRTPPGIKPKIKRGAMAISLASKVEPTIVHITCEPLSLIKGNPWWNVPDESMFFTIEVCGQLNIEPYFDLYQNDPPKATRALAQEVYTSLFKHYDFFD